MSAQGPVCGRGLVGIRRAGAASGVGRAVVSPVRAVLTAAALLLSAFARPAAAGIIVDHQPHNFGGLGSDTSFTFPGLPFELWQRVADDFILDEPATVRRVNWWGFYDRDNPPATETMRLRVYGARPSDGLPDDGQIVLEETVLNPERTWTGRLVGVGIAPHEYFFTADLTSSLRLEGDIKYWLEVVQVGDIATHFRWELSLAERNGQAFINNGGAPDWTTTLPNGDVDTAFQLSTIPEPSSLILIGVRVLFVRRRRLG